MLNNNHVQMFMSFIRIKNEEKKSKGKVFRTPDELKEVEHNVIQFVNFYNKIVNFFRNNKFSLWIKEAFYSLFGTPYPEFLYNKERNDYINFLQYGQTEDKRPFTEFRVTSDVEYAIDFSKYWFWKKKKFLKDIKLAIAQYNNQCEIESKQDDKIIGEYYFRKILTYEQVG